MNKILIIIGGDTAAEIEPVAQQYYGDKFNCITRHYFSQASAEALQNWKNEFDQVFYCMGIVDSQLSAKVVRIARELGISPFTIIHPSASIAASATVGEGCFIAQQAVISVHVEIGNHSIVHFHSSIGHHTKLGSEVKILPGARISGNVRIGDRVLVGSNAFVLQSISIGEGSKIDALSYVRHDLEPNMLVSGKFPNPVKLPFTTNK